MSTVLRFQEENTSLYQYIKDSLVTLDKISKYENFHINFLINLLKFLGIKPEASNENCKFFDIEKIALKKTGGVQEVIFVFPYPCYHLLVKEISLFLKLTYT